MIKKEKNKFEIDHESWFRGAYGSEIVNKAIFISKNFIKDIPDSNIVFTLHSSIASGNGTIGKYCILHTSIKNNVGLSIQLNIENGNNRLDTSIKIKELKNQFGNYFNTEDLKNKLIEILNN